MVKLAKDHVLKVLHITLLVQSNKYDADYLEHRVNEFLYSHKSYTEASVEGNKNSILNAFMQKNTNMQQECQLNWAQLLNKEFEFDRRDQQIEAMKKVTVDQVNDLMTETFFKNPKRINLKIHSHAKEADIEKRQTSKDLNKEFYEKLESEFDTQLNQVTIDPQDIASF